MIPSAYCQCQIVDQAVGTLLRNVDDDNFSAFAQCAVCFFQCQSKVLHVAWTSVEKNCVIEVFAVIGFFGRIDFYIESAFSCDCRHSFSRLDSVFDPDVVTVCKKFLEQCAAASDRKNFA